MVVLRNELVAEEEGGLQKIRCLKESLGICRLTRDSCLRN